MTSNSWPKRVGTWNLYLGSVIIMTLVAASWLTLTYRRRAAAVVALSEDIVRVGGRVELVDVPRGSNRILTINLAKTSIADAWLATLSPARDTVCNLVLSDTQISDKGMTRLPALGQLMSLSLAGTAITDSGLASLKACPRLKVVNVADTHVSAAGIADLKKALPGVIVSTRRPPG